MCIMPLWHYAFIYFRAVFSNLLLVRGTPSCYLRYLAPPPACFLGIQINELKLLAAPLAPAFGTLVYRGNTVGNHCFRGAKKKKKRRQELFLLPFFCGTI